MSTSATAGFDESALPPNTLAIYGDLLNVVGSRMRANPQAKITLTGCNNGREGERRNTRLSRNRANAVRDYLVTTWGIDTKRIRVKARNLPAEAPSTESVEGQQETRRVEISSDTYAVLAPVRWQSVEHSVSTPNIVLRPTVESGAGVNRWSLAVTQGNESVASFDGTEAPPAELTWELDTTRLPQAGCNVDVRLEVEDNIGQKRTAEVALPFETETVTTEVIEQQGNRRIDRFSLILFDFKKSDIGSDNRRILDIVREAITPRSRVTIYGFADRTGSPEINRELALDRCTSVKNALSGSLRGIPVNLEAVGSDRLLFDNDIPEGRNYCRTVQIVVETGID